MKYPPKFSFCWCGRKKYDKDAVCSHGKEKAPRGKDANPRYQMDVPKDVPNKVMISITL